MDESIKTVSAEEIAGAVLANFETGGIFDWCGIEITYRRLLSLADMTLFVNTVVNGCFDEATGEYAPEAKHFALQLAIVSFYTNIDLGDDMVAQYEILNASDLVGEIIDHIDLAQFNELTDAIDEKIRYRSESNVAALQNKIESAYNEFEMAVGQMQNTFSGVSEDDLEKLIGAIADGGFDEKKLMDAYLDGKYGQAE